MRVEWSARETRRKDQEQEGRAGRTRGGKAGKRSAGRGSNEREVERALNLKKDGKVEGSVKERREGESDRVKRRRYESCWAFGGRKTNEPKGQAQPSPPVLALIATRFLCLCKRWTPNLHRWVSPCLSEPFKNRNLHPNLNGNSSSPSPRRTFLPVRISSSLSNLSSSSRAEGEEGTTIEGAEGIEDAVEEGSAVTSEAEEVEAEGCE